MEHISIRQLQAVLSIAAYLLSSLAIVYFNRWVFTTSFKYPVFVSWFQQFAGLFFYYGFAFTGRRTQIRAFTRFHLVLPQKEVLWKVFPVAVAFVLMVATANLCLQVVQVSTYQVARSLTIIFTIIFTFYILGEGQKKLSLMGCGLIVMGFVLNTCDPATLSVSGLLLGSCSSMFQSCYNVLVKQRMRFVHDDANLMLLYNQYLSSVLFLPMIFLSGEGEAFRKLPTWSDSEYEEKVVALFGSAILGIGINLTSYLCIHYTSALTFNIAGFAKSLLQSLGGIVLIGDVVTPKSFWSLLLSLLGTAAYSVSKYHESQQMVPRVVGEDQRSGALEAGTAIGQSVDVEVELHPVTGRKKETFPTNSEND